jgi:hypothetical protein
MKMLTDINQHFQRKRFMAWRPHQSDENAYRHQPAFSEKCDKYFLNSLSWFYAGIDYPLKRFMAWRPHQSDENAYRHQPAFSEKMTDF